MEIRKKGPERKTRYTEGRPQNKNWSREDDGGRKPARKAAGTRKSYGDEKPYGERKAYGASKPFGTRKSYGDEKPYGERKSYGASKPYGERKAAITRKPVVKRKKVAEAPPTEVRLNKFIANSGICSRREADRIIESGAVTVNGKVVTELGTKIDVRKDVVLFGDQKLRGEEKVYIIMNKPKGFVTTTSDPHADQTVMDLLTKCPNRVFPVGRLDKNTTGVLMFTNDGELSEKLTHPSFNKKKIYEVTLDRKLDKADAEKILKGIELEDGMIKADELDYVDSVDLRKIGIEIHSGRNRIVRRIFEAIGYNVKALDRVYFAGLTKKGIKRGQWRYLTEGEVNVLKMGAFN